METVKCKYQFSKDYNPVYANGAYGGISPLGEIIINFYLERTPLPKSQTFEITEPGRRSPSPIDVEPTDLEQSVLRFVNTGVVLNYQTAKEIHRWLGIHLETLEKIKDL